MSSGISVVIPTVGMPRRTLLNRALASIWAQTLLPDAVIVAQDTDRQGAATTRSRGLDAVTTEWTALLDDDDEFLPHHLEHLAAHAAATEADYVFGDFEVPGSPTFHLASFCYGEWEPHILRQTTITVLVRTAVAQAVGGFREPSPGQYVGRDYMGEDAWFTRRINDAGYKISHLQETTWRWWHHAFPGNSSGLPTRIDWDSAT